MTYELDEPAVITPADHPGVPEMLREPLEQRGRRYLRLHVLSTAPGALGAALAAPGEETVEPPVTPAPA